MDYVAPIIAAVAWPAIAIVLIALFYPSVRRVLEARSFHVKYGDAELSVQDSTDELRKQISDLQDQVAALRVSAPDNGVQLSAPALDVERTRRRSGGTILWVDDRPNANAYERAKFEDDGFRIIRSTTTDDALRKLRAGLTPYVIISDMSRVEDGVRIPDAGIQLLKAVREFNENVPFFIYTGTDSAEAYRDAAAEADANGITSSSVTLIQYVERIGT